MTKERCADYVVAQHEDAGAATWEGELCGPSGSPFEGARIPFTLKFPADYPFKAPTWVFKSHSVLNPAFPFPGSSEELALLEAEVLSLAASRTGDITLVTLTGKELKVPVTERTTLRELYGRIQDWQGTSPSSIALVTGFREDKEVKREGKQWIPGLRDPHLPIRTAARVPATAPTLAPTLLPNPAP